MTNPRVGFISQFNDPTTNADNTNCTSAAFCMLGELAAQKHLYPGQFRRLQADQAGGISIPDGARAWPRAYPGVGLAWAAPNDGIPVPAGRRGDGVSPDTAWQLLVQGAGLVEQGDYDVFAAAGISLQPGFTDPHAIYVDGARTITRGRQAYILDPLGRDDYAGRWVDWNVVVRYGQKLSQSSIIYVAWAFPALPDTGTEEPVGVPVAFDSHFRGKARVNGSGHSFVNVASGENVAVVDGWEPDEVLYLGHLYKDFTLKGGGTIKKGTAVIVIGTNEAILLRQDVTLTADPPVSGDVKHVVESKLLVDGVVVDSAKVSV